MNSKWLSRLPTAEANFLCPGSSDHSPVVVRLGIDLHSRRTPFKFFNLWAEHPDFDRVVQQAWNFLILGTPMFRVCKKLKHVKEALKSFNREHFSNLQCRTREARSQLQHIQTDLLNLPGDSSLKEREKEALKNLSDLVRAEEHLFQQKSRIMWLANGDSNTSYFHNSLKDRYNKNMIVSLELEDGQKIYDMQ